MNVYDAANKRLEFIFNHFDTVSVSFSGGKDSGVLLNLTIDYAKKHSLLDKVAVMHLDYEAQYQMTTDYVRRVEDSLPEEVTVHHVCMPIRAQCSTSMFQSSWTPWDPAKRDIWVRQLPDNSININNHQFGFWKDGMTDYDFQEQYGQWLHGMRHDSNTAILVGIRTQESLNRWRAIHSDKNHNKFRRADYSKKMFDGVYNFYPIYDWITEDIWTANAKFGWDYNKLYDIYYQAGVSIDQMRVASPFNDYAQSSLKLYRVLDPDNWGRMISRVNGVNFTSIYGGTTLMGWKSIKKPNHFTWKQYMEFLLSTLPGAARDNYLRKLEASKKSWRVGGARDSETIQELVDEGSPVRLTGKTNNRGNKNKQVIQFDDYLDDTMAKDFKSIPTYKRMCICIMKNDTACKYMGFAQTKQEIKLRREAMEKYAKIL